MQIKFVDTIPRADSVKEDCLYISVKYNMTTHQCACGCGTIVPLPISPADWSLAYDGEHVSLNPSVGNGALACRSHYFIRDNQIVWLPKMSEEQTHAQLESDKTLLEQRAQQQKQQAASGRLIRRMINKLVSFFRKRQ